MSPTLPMSSTWRRSAPPASRSGSIRWAARRVHYWQPIIERYGLAATIVSDAIDPTFRFMTVDWDGKIRMDCSSPYAMARLIGMRDKFDVAFANDTDADRHGIVTRSNGLMNPNHYLAAAIAYLFEHRPRWNGDCAVGKTIVSSAIIDRVAKKLGRRLVETPGRLQMVRRRPDRRLVRICRRGKRRRLVPAARWIGVDHRQGRHHSGTARRRDDGANRPRPRPVCSIDLTRELGVPFYERIDAPATPAQKNLLKALSADKLGMTELAGEPVQRGRHGCARQRPAVRRHQGRHPTTDGSRRGRPAPRMSTRSMPRVFAARPICGRSSTKRSSPSRRHSLERSGKPRPQRRDRRIADRIGGLPIGLADYVCSICPVAAHRRIRWSISSWHRRPRHRDPTRRSRPRAPKTARRR